jgi:phosphatidylserine decarboxylase
VVLVGAFGVGRITLSVCDLVTNDGSHPPREEALDTAVDKGAELGVFHLGSTVVLVAPPGRWRWTVREGDSVRMGRAIAVATAALPEA